MTKDEHKEEIVKAVDEMGKRMLMLLEDRSPGNCRLVENQIRRLGNLSNEIIKDLRINRQMNNLDLLLLRNRAAVLTTYWFMYGKGPYMTICDSDYLDTKIAKKFYGALV